MRPALLLLLASAAYADPKPSIDAITWKIFDRTKGTVVAVDKGDPYGVDQDLLVLVKLRGPNELGGMLTLESSTKASSSEATGDVAATKDVQTHKVDRLSDSGVGWQLFVVPYQCSDSMTFTATLKAGASTLTKTAKHNFACAE